jgi:5-methyltetrahydrofolate--homocysteine methyltransferase
VVYSTPAGVFASYLPALVEAGAAFIGGCCGTTPEFIRALAGENVSRRVSTRQA